MPDTRVTPDRAEGASPAYYIGRAARIAAHFMSGLVLAWQLHEWLFYPAALPFPYGPYSLVVVFAAGVQWLIWRLPPTNGAVRARRRRTARTAVGLGLVLAGVELRSLRRRDHAAPLVHVNPKLSAAMRAFCHEARVRFGVVAVEHLGAYVDRPMRGAAERPSAHAYGQAIDLSGFRFADGTEARVWAHNQPGVAQHLAPLVSLARRRFDSLLWWGNDPAVHGSHLHAEVVSARRSLIRAPGGGQ